MNSLRAGATIGAMRYVLTATLCAFLMAGCGGGGEADEGATTEPPLTWEGVAELRPRDGVLDVEEFGAYTERVDEEFEVDPEALVREYLRVEDGEVTADGPRTTLLRDSLEDDSVRAERWLLDLAQEGGTWWIVAARWEQRCHENRGHQDFSPQLCI
jgi:hypothetical protein